MSCWNINNQIVLYVLFQPIKFTTGQKRTLQIPLRNVGDIAFDIDLTFTQWPNLFTVHPSEVSSSPGSECIVTVSFAAPIDIMENKFDRYIVGISAYVEVLIIIINLL